MKPVPLKEIHDEIHFGGKAAQLGMAIRGGLPVPPGYAVAVETVEAVVKSEPSAIASVEACFRALGGAVAVRSSAVGEDSDYASFAGQYVSYLNICSPSTLIEAIQGVYESGQSPTVLAYRRRLGINERSRIAVIVQQMVEPRCAGVLFTCNPLTSASELVIEAAWGLGEAVVAGLITPDRFRISHDGIILERTPGVKALSVQPVAGGGTAMIRVGSSQAHALCLNDDQLDQLHSLAKQCDLRFAGHHDIEWAFANGSVYLLQRRPVTRMNRVSTFLELEKYPS